MILIVGVSKCIKKIQDGHTVNVLGDSGPSSRGCGRADAFRGVSGGSTHFI